MGRLHVPGDSHLPAGSETDMNRNFPYDWAPEPHQVGAGAFAASEPEARAVTAFASRHPEHLRVAQPALLRRVLHPASGDKPDRQMNQTDLALYLQIGEWTQAIAGYPMVSGFEEFTYEPDKPLRGELSAFAYAQRGAVAMVCELWDFWKQAGLTVHRPFVLNYTRRTRADIEQMAAGIGTHNGGRVVGGWVPFEHPQLGPVEVGGYDPRVGIWNPPEDRPAGRLHRAREGLAAHRRARAPRPHRARRGGPARRWAHARLGGGGEPRLPAHLRARLGQGAAVERRASRASRPRDGRLARGRRDLDGGRPPRGLGWLHEGRDAVLRAEPGRAATTPGGMGGARAGDRHHRGGGRARRLRRCERRGPVASPAGAVEAASQVD